ncbi:MAG: TVP38/TMEM64 family protein [Thermoleophilaceae bacterium]
MPPLRRLLALALLVAGAFAAAVLLLPHDANGLRALAATAGAAAPLIALGAWLVLTPALFPGTVLAAAGGLAFGSGAGVAVGWAGALIGALAAFGIARGVGRRPAEQLLAGRLERIRGLLERRGFTAVLLARLTPGVPATALNYAAGVSRVRVRHFAGAMAIGAAIRTAPYALLGAGMGAGSVAGVGIAVASIAVGGVAAALLALGLRRRPRPAA